MKHFKKRTLSLVLASVVTVVGAFGSVNYKNSLMGLSFERGENNNINMVLHTKAPYNGNMTPVKKDANTYILMLPEINSLASTPDLSKIGNITSVNIRTMPYSNNAKGYTKITIKTLNPSSVLMAKNQLYIATNEMAEPTDVYDRAPYQQTYHEEPEAEPNYYTDEVVQPESIEDFTYQEDRTETSIPAEESNNVSENDTNNGISTDASLAKKSVSSQNTSDYEDETFPYYAVWALLIALISLFFFVKAKNKMSEIAGEKLDFDTDNEKPSKIDKIKKTIQYVDKAYSTAPVLNNNREFIKLNQQSKNRQEIEELEIVNLDELFQEHKTKNQGISEEENQALEDFLSGFSFDDEIYNQEFDENKETISYDEEYFEKVVKNKSLKFNEHDLICLKKILDLEISDELMRDVHKYALSNPIKTIKGTSNKDRLEKLIMEYSISQHIKFTTEDVEILNKLINVEIDSDFVTDLKTNRHRVDRMEREILTEKPKKISEIVFLKVKDFLPNLSEALKKQGTKPIESEKRAETVYFTEGYDVKTLVLDEELPDLSKEINRKDAYKSKPSAGYDTVDYNYNVGNSVISIPSKLPDSSDSHIVKQDIDIVSVEKAPTVTDIQKELCQINKNIEIIEEEDFDFSKNIEKENEAEVLKVDNMVVMDNTEDVLKKENKLVNSVGTSCYLDGQLLYIVSSVDLGNDKGCYLAKNEHGYYIIGFIGEKTSVLKQYQELKSEKIQARLSKKISDEAAQYIIRIGLKKFILNVKEDNIEYVMDLC